MPPLSPQETLERLLQELPPDRKSGLQPKREHRIFVNRGLDLTNIKAIGFDMDYTLAEYHQDEVDRLTMELALGHMVTQKGYPQSILTLPYRKAFAIRGLVMDTQLGNVLKVDEFMEVSMAYHGLQRLGQKQRDELYRHGRINLGKKRFRSVDTLFEILEAYLFAALIEHLEGKAGKAPNYRNLYTDLRFAIDLCHRDDSLKNQIMGDPDRFFQNDPHLIPTLHMLKDSGRKLFVLTNSEPHYTNFVLTHLFRHSEPYFPDWRSCFDLVCASSAKPQFFRGGTPCQPLEESPPFYAGGNLSYLEEALGIGGDEVLYVGDHIFGDILKSKHSSHWRTCFIVPELHHQIIAENLTMDLLRTLRVLESRHKEIDMQTIWRRNQLMELRHYESLHGSAVTPALEQQMNTRIGELAGEIEALDQELTQVMASSIQMRRRISATFNPFWGRLFKTGGHLSLFAGQIRSYADIYTSRVSNFGFYNCECNLQSEAALMPHEDGLSPVRDLDFDISMNGLGQLIPAEEGAL